MSKSTPAEDTKATPVAKTPHINVAVLNIAGDLASEGIGKDRKNKSQDFKFRGIDDFLNVLAPKYVREKMLVLPSYSNRVQTEYKSKNGGRIASVTIEGTYKLVSLVDGSELITGPFIGEGMDSGDKATNKAMSIAYKYFAIQTFAIPVVGTEDPDFESHEVEPARSAKKRGEEPEAEAADEGGDDESVADLIERLGGSKEARKKLTKIILGAYDIVVLDDLPEDKVEEAKQRLKTFVAKAAK